jgi:hypothetical protein
MSELQDFVAVLVRAGRTVSEIKKSAEVAYDNKSLTRSQIYRIIKSVKDGENTEDQRPLNSKKTKRTLDLVAAVAAAVEEDAHLNIDDLAAAHRVSKRTIFNILYDNLGLSKKSARWLLKMLFTLPPL